MDQQEWTLPAREISMRSSTRQTTLRLTGHARSQEPVFTAVARGESARLECSGA